MIKVTNILSRMAIAVPLAAAVPVALYCDAVSLLGGRQWHWDQHWQRFEHVHASGYRDQTVLEAHGTPYCHTYRVQDTTTIGIVPVVRQADNLRGEWNVESDISARPGYEARHNNGGRLLTALESGDYIASRYTTKSGVDIGQLLMYFPSDAIRKPTIA